MTLPTIYQVDSAESCSKSVNYELASLAPCFWLSFAVLFQKEHYLPIQMTRDKNFTKKSAQKVSPNRLLKFLDQNFDWIVLAIITLLMALVFVFFK